MSFSSLVQPGNIRSSSQRSSRGGAAIDHFILHHSAAFDVNQVLNEMVTGSRQVSANYVVANDGTLYGVVDEEDRAWTSGSTTDGGQGAAWDKRSITFEILDQTGAPDWLISDAAQKTVAAVIADCSKRYGIVPQRAGDDHGWTVYGHRELYTIYGASYSTACPGGLPLDGVTQAAAALLAPPKPKENNMTRYQFADSTGNIVGRYIVGPGYVHGIANHYIFDFIYQGGGEVIQIPTGNEFPIINAESGIPQSEFNKIIGDVVWNPSANPPAVTLTDAQIASVAAAIKVPAPDLSSLASAIAGLSAQEKNDATAIEAILAKGLTGTITVTPAK